MTPDGDAGRKSPGGDIEEMLDELARDLTGPLGTDARVERIRSALPAAFREYRQWGYAAGRAEASGADGAQGEGPKPKCGHVYPTMGDRCDAPEAAHDAAYLARGGHPFVAAPKAHGR